MIIYYDSRPSLTPGVLIKTAAKSLLAQNGLTTDAEYRLSFSAE